MKTAQFLLVAIAVSLSGCGLYHQIEIEKISAKHVPRAEIREITGSDAGYPGVIDWVKSDLIVLEFSSKDNLIKLRKKMSSSLGADGYFCDEPNRRVLLAIPELYIDGKSSARIWPGQGATPATDDEIDNLINRYHVIIFWQRDTIDLIPKSFRGDPSQIYYDTYNLRNEPRDVCIKLSGSNIVQMLESNQIMITKEEIQKLHK